jgi:hypothetical protein
MRRSVLWALSFRTSDAAPVITRYRVLNKQSMSRMTSTSECQLEAHLWVTFVQSDAKVQPVFRLYRNYDTRSPYVGEGAFSEARIAQVQHL